MAFPSRAATTSHAHAGVRLPGLKNGDPLVPVRRHVGKKAMEGGQAQPVRLARHPHLDAGILSSKNCRNTLPKKMKPLAAAQATRDAKLQALLGTPTEAHGLGCNSVPSYRLRHSLRNSYPGLKTVRRVDLRSRFINSRPMKWSVRAGASGRHDVPTRRPRRTAVWSR